MTQKKTSTKSRKVDQAKLDKIVDNANERLDAAKAKEAKDNATDLISVDDTDAIMQRAAEIHQARELARIHTQGKAFKEQVTNWDVDRAGHFVEDLERSGFNQWVAQQNEAFRLQQEALANANAGDNANAEVPAN